MTYQEKKVYAERIEDGSEEELDFNKDSDKWIFFKSYPYGKEVNENMLLAGDILCVSKSFDGSYIRGWQCSQTVSGKVEKVAGNTEDTFQDEYGLPARNSEYS